MRDAEILVIGSRERLRTIPGSGSVIDERDLERAQAFTVVEALRQAPGVFVREEEGLGIRPNIGIRGLNPIRSTKVLLLEDGIPLGFAPYGDNAAYYHPPLERFERIEVLKGAAQIRFGPQTIGGVINYITPDPPESFEGRVNLAGGNRGYLETNARLGGPLGSGGVLVHGNYKRSDGNRKNQRLRFADLFAKAAFTLSDTQDLELRASHSREDSQVSYSGLTRAEFAADPRGNPFGRNDEFKTRRWSTALAHGLDVGTTGRLTTTAYYHSFDRDWWRQSSNSAQRPNDASDPTCSGLANLDTTCGNEGRLRAYDTYGIETRLSFDHGAIGIPGTTEAGVRYHREEQRRRQLNGDTPRARSAGTGINGGVRENQRRTLNAMSGFVQSSFELGPLNVQPGVRVEAIDFARRNLPISVLSGGRPTGALTPLSAGSTELTQVIPSVGATLGLAPRFVLYGGIHRGFAPPRVEDVITGSGGTVELDAEKSWNYEFGVRGDPLPGLYADLTLFQMDFSNQIVSASVAGGVGATLTSAGRTTHRGAELSGRFSSRAAGLTRGSDLFARAAVTWVADADYDSTRIARAPCFDSGAAGALVRTSRGPVPCGVDIDVNGNRLPYSPAWLASAAVGAEVGALTGQVEVQHQSGMWADDVNLVPVTPDGQRGRIAGWTMVNATLNVAPASSALSGFVAVKNIFDKLYVTDRARGILVGTPRLFQVGLSYRF